jgi:hypothetical protein
VTVRCGSVVGNLSTGRGSGARRCADAGRATGKNAATAPEQTSSATARKVARLDIEENDDSLLQGMRAVPWIAVAFAGFLVAGSAPAAQTRMLPLQLQARVAVKRAVHSGWIDNATAARSRAQIDRAARLIRRLPSERADPIDVALSEIAAMSGRLTKPRALALTGQLKANSDYLARRGPPKAHTDIKDADGLVYRFFAGRCFEFHPLAEFVELNARVWAKDVKGTRRLADALAARGSHQFGGTAWEYYFPYGGGSAPWLSGMAQAVAAMGFTRAADLVPDSASTYVAAARGAYRVIPARLLTNISAGPWVRLYSFDSTAVLNAQLQTIYSLKTYAARARDTRADALATRMQTTAITMLPRFDTGYWSYYSLGGALSPLEYQKYVVDLLKSLSTSDARFGDAAKRFAVYLRQPPAFQLEHGPLGALRFWLSKPATVTAYSAAGRTQRYGMRDGWHTIGWAEPKGAGIYPIHVSAVDWAGNRSSFDAPPIVRVGAGAVDGTARAAASSPAKRVPLFIGAGLDDPVQAARAQKLGLHLVRIVVDWPTGQTTPELALVAALRQLTGSQVLLELRTAAAPTDDSTRTALAEYAAALVQQVPGMRYLTLAPAVAATGTADYAAAYVAVHDAVKAALPSVALAPLLDGSSSPKTTLTALARAVPAEDVDVFAFRPAGPTAAGWTADDVPQLLSTLGDAFGRAPPLLIDGLATPTTIPSDQVAWYPATQQPDPSAVTAKEQGSSYARLISSTACSTTISAIVLDRLVDDNTFAEPTTGIVYAGGEPKPSAPLVSAAAGPTQRGTVICPGLASRSGASTLRFPEELDPSASASVVLGCVRDCLYVITLTDGGGRPVSARRGTLTGGSRPIRLELPKVKLAGSSYRFDVRIVDRVNPGEVSRTTSESLPVSR